MDVHCYCQRLYSQGQHNCLFDYPEALLVCPSDKIIANKKFRRYGKAELFREQSATVPHFTARLLRGLPRDKK
jgi:hypothetical protein